ncbi:hypothetical protein NQ317_010081 [Molorchus minor]|uniref:Uncharacterized protein n=1 Tax=Molorchus minor TaxID=1323400 RepID=A0ABQ9JI45_9CUCU|nr:hypothetical protein NQ317_010081 [Molorchus minor]
MVRHLNNSPRTEPVPHRSTSSQLTSGKSTMGGISQKFLALEFDQSTNLSPKVAAQVSSIKTSPSARCSLVGRFLNITPGTAFYRGLHYQVIKGPETHHITELLFIGCEQHIE